ncbi:hypothetical protein FB451DRAFT_1126839 [Mycena latifolia]|nr:hypothetical protein FB451DRAFT_1126839 [Mycena latifolia]
MDATIIDAGPPFSPSYDEMNPSDIILRSCDGVDFHAHKAILSFSSQFFQDMLAFPQPEGADANFQRDGRPVILVPESSKAIEKLLSLCYPRLTSNFSDLDGVDEAYQAADKYQINGGQKLLEQIMSDPRFLSKEPHRVYAIACHRGLAELAKTAAAATLKLPSVAKDLISVPEYKLISAHQFLRLQHCRDQCISQMEGYLATQASSEYVLLDPVWWDWDGHSSKCGVLVLDLDSDTTAPSPWFTEHVNSIRDRMRTLDGVDPQVVATWLCKVEGKALEAMAPCSKCLRLASNHLGELSVDFLGCITAAHAQILTETSFVE